MLSFLLSSDRRSLSAAGAALAGVGAAGALYAAYAAGRRASAGAGASSSPSSPSDLSTTSSSHSGAVYETERAVQEYLLFHFGADAAIMPYAASAAVPTGALRFAQRTARVALAALARASPAVAVGSVAVLDVGCAVGGSSYEFSAAAGRVVGFDFSRRFVEAASDARRSARGAHAGARRRRAAPPAPPLAAHCHRRPRRSAAAARCPFPTRSRASCRRPRWRGCPTVRGQSACALPWATLAPCRPSSPPAARTTSST